MAGAPVGRMAHHQHDGNRLTQVASPQGFGPESPSAAVILASACYGYPLSTTQVGCGGVTGAGLGRRLASVHWDVVSRW